MSAGSADAQGALWGQESRCCDGGGQGRGELGQAGCTVGAESAPGSAGQFVGDHLITYSRIGSDPGVMSPVS